MPPLSINETDNPDADQTGQGDSVPIVLGNVQYAKLVKFSNLKNPLTLVQGGGKSFTLCNGVNYFTDGLGGYYRGLR